MTRRSGAISRREYVIGFPGQHQCVYGPVEKGKAMYCDRLTLAQAKKDVGRGRMVIYRLVPIRKRKKMVPA